MFLTPLHEFPSAVIRASGDIYTTFVVTGVLYKMFVSKVLQLDKTVKSLWGIHIIWVFGKIPKKVSRSEMFVIGYRY